MINYYYYGGAKGLVEGKQQIVTALVGFTVGDAKSSDANSSDLPKRECWAEVT